MTYSMPGCLFIVGLLCYSTSLFAGGLFSDTTAFSKDIINPATRGILLAAPPKPDAPAMQTFQQALDGAKTPIGNVPPQTYESLQAAKTPEQKLYETQAAKALGFDVSNICLTISHACAVTYTTTGSSCFCTVNGRVELGLVK